MTHTDGGGFEYVRHGVKYLVEDDGSCWWIGRTTDGIGLISKKRPWEGKEWLKEFYELFPKPKISDELIERAREMEKVLCVPKYIVYGKFNGVGKKYTWLSKKHYGHGGTKVTSKGYKRYIVLDGWDNVEAAFKEHDDEWGDEYFKEVRGLNDEGKLKELIVEKVLDKEE